jgi:porphobilinogen synthase
MTTFPTARGRRLRVSAAMRRQVAETRLASAMFVLLLFVVEGAGVEQPIASMPGHAQLSVDRLIPVVEEAAAAGVGGVILFGIPGTKDEEGSGAWDPAGPVPTAIRAIKDRGLDLTVWADLCLCEYTSHGHCGVVVDQRVDNDATLPLLARSAAVYADAGADVIAPSDMMDGRVAAVRAAIDVPVAAYQVSGEFAMIEAAAANGWIDGDRIMMESLTGIARAGADIILTYFATRAARLLEAR